MVRVAQQFIHSVKDDIHKTITDMRTVDEGYDGFDSERDTDEEVEAALRCGPEVLSRDDELFGLSPIRCITTMQSEDNTHIVCNTKAASFVPLFARLAIEFNSFEETERGGLLVECLAGSRLFSKVIGDSVR